MDASGMTRALGSRRASVDRAFAVAVADPVHDLVQPLEFLLLGVGKEQLLSGLFGLQAQRAETEKAQWSAGSDLPLPEDPLGSFP